jgi:cytochrome P450
VAHTNKDIFPDPWTFNPERWLGAEGKNRQKFQLAFGKGHRKCLGINLANAVLCLAIATAAKYDMHLFETDEKDVRFQYDFQISHPRLDSKGVRATVKGKAASI